MRLLAYAVTLTLALLAADLPAQGLVDEDTDRLLVEAVTAAVELDLYNTRCRSDASGRRAAHLNRILASRLRLTLVRVQDELFPERSYRRVQERLQQDFLERLREAGGCQGAKAAGMAEALNERYNSLLRAIEAIP